MVILILYMKKNSLNQVQRTFEVLMQSRPTVFFLNLARQLRIRYFVAIMVISYTST